MHRLAAALVALAAWAGLVVQFAATFGQTGSLPETLWILLRFFTVITNLLVGIMMTRVAMGRRVSPFILAGLTLAIVFVGLVYAALLHGLVELSGLALTADVLLHYVVPVAMAVYWPVFARRSVSSSATHCCGACIRSLTSSMSWSADRSTGAILIRSSTSRLSAMDAYC